MKKTYCLLLAIFALLMLFNACSKKNLDIDLYADYKDITVVYGLLDPGKDTNYVKINKAFLGPGNAKVFAKNPDSCNYPIGQIEAKLIEKRTSAGGSNYNDVREIKLEPIMIHDKDTGIFYAPEQLVYFTKAKINSNDDRFSYQYELQIDRGDTILTATTDMLGGGRFYITTGSLNFANDGQVRWLPCDNAAVYEIIIKFRFTEISPSQDSVERCMSYSLGTFSKTSLANNMDHNQFLVTSKASLFYSKLASFLGNDTVNPAHPENAHIDRLINAFPVGIAIAAGGEELYNYITVNGPSSSIVQNIPEYTNIKGGYGIFSTRTMIETWVNLGSTQADLINNHENWRFRQGSFSKE